jgi:hypothetical protein
MIRSKVNLVGSDGRCGLDKPVFSLGESSLFYHAIFSIYWLGTITHCSFHQECLNKFTYTYITLMLYDVVTQRSTFMAVLQTDCNTLNGLPVTFLGSILPENILVSHWKYNSQNSAIMLNVIDTYFRSIICSWLLHPSLSHPLHHSPTKQPLWCESTCNAAVSNVISDPSSGCIQCGGDPSYHCPRADICAACNGYTSWSRYAHVDYNHVLPDQLLGWFRSLHQNVMVLQRVSPLYKTAQLVWGH